MADEDDSVTEVPLTAAFRPPAPWLTLHLQIQYMNVVGPVKPPTKAVVSQGFQLTAADVYKRFAKPTTAWNHPPNST